jgi:hypothetical protein
MSLHSTLSNLSPFSKTTLYYFPIAAVINYHKLSDFKQHKFIILQLKKSRVLNQSLS